MHPAADRYEGLHYSAVLDCAVLLPCAVCHFVLHATCRSHSLVSPYALTLSLPKHLSILCMACLLPTRVTLLSPALRLRPVHPLRLANLAQRSACCGNHTRGPVVNTDRRHLPGHPLKTRRGALWGRGCCAHENECCAYHTCRPHDSAMPSTPKTFISLQFHV